MNFIKYSFRQINLKSCVFLLALLIASCGDDDVQQKDSFGVFTFQDDMTVIMNGVIGSNTLEDWDKYIQAYPSTIRIIMKDCPGSEDDVANLEAARKVYQKRVSIHLPSDAQIASGAVDFFLSGEVRTREAGSKIGVHSWSDGENEATDFAVGHTNHLPYINFYKEVGFSQSEAEAFYYFTIHAAPADDIYYMTDAEISQYKLLTE